VASGATVILQNGAPIPSYTGSGILSFAPGSNAVVGGGDTTQVFLREHLVEFEQCLRRRSVEFTEKLPLLAEQFSKHRLGIRVAPLAICDPGIASQP
jgi:hypothetical protein